MSLITRQLLGQAELERDSLIKLFQQGDRSQLMNNKIQHCMNLIKKYQKQLGEEEAAQKALRPPPREPVEPVEPAVKERDPLPEDILLQCKDCGDDFNFPGKDQLFFKRKNFPAPVRCSVCREERENNKPQPITLSCCDCHEEFKFSVQQQREFKENDWPQPKRCRPCAKDKKARFLASKAIQAANV